MKKEIASALVATSIALNSSPAIAEFVKVKVPDSTPETRTDLPAESNYSQEVTPGSRVYMLQNPDQETVLVDFSKAIGFTPDKNLVISPLKTKKLGQESAKITRDFQKYLNTSRNGFGPLAGYTDGTNDYNQYQDHQSGPQVPAYSWMVHTGLTVDMPGIGRVDGGPGRAVVVLILNRTDKVYRFPTNSVTVEAGFQGWGRLWDGNAKETIEAEKRLTNHYLTRLGEGVPETGFIGQTDQGERNADSATVITVERTQWGKNEDGTPRYQFQLLRAETVPAIKK